MACRFPGNANSPDEFWQLLCNGSDPIRTVPHERWDIRSYFSPDRAAQGKMHSRWGGFIDGIDLFDADFFGISPREAARMDPQHRLLLEIAYEALEDGGVTPEQLAGTAAGVFVGISTCDYGAIQASPSERDTIDAYTNIGLGFCIAANRISHQFDLHGPSLAIDTACSSSLVAAHFACQSIWSGECSVALVGGVNALLRPESTIGFSKASMLAPSGRCRSFDALVEGYVRSEGAGILLLKPLTRAQADGDRIYAVIRGTMVNQDGRTPGLALPSRAAQELLLRSAYEKAGIDPRHVHFVEAHGTGTPAGDPIELGAIGAVLGAGRKPGDRCVIGSVKSNIGHLEAASGIAGMMKAALCIERGAIPSNLHFETPNPNIPFDALNLRVAQEFQPWTNNGSSARLAGVNSFGFGGTNAHVILDAPPRAIAPAIAAVADRPRILRLSARSSAALEASARAYRALLADEAHAGSAVTDICYSAALRRGDGNHRLTMVGTSKQEFIEQLDAFTAGESRPAMASGRRSVSQSTNLAFVYPGMGQQWWGMGRQLLAEEPVFRDMVERCDALLRDLGGWSLLEELSAGETDTRIHQTQIAQPAIFAVQAALTALWRSWGVVPGLIIGHSVGEIAAAHAAGILSLEDAVRLVYHRSRLQQRFAGQGEMLAIMLPWREAEKLVQPYEGRVSIAAINSPEDVSLSGDAEALRAIAATLAEREIFSRYLRVEVPYHSPRIEPLKGELLETLAGLRPQPATAAMYSTTLARLVEGPELDAGYWWRNARHAVRFADAIEAAMASDHLFFLEIGAHPVLPAAIARCLAERKKEGAVVTSLRRNEPERVTMLGSLGKLYTLGLAVDWRRQFPEGGRMVKLPSYQWQRERFWHESDETRRDRIGLNVHPLLGRLMHSANPSWVAEIDVQRLPYLREHRVQDAVMYPAAAYVEMALGAARELFGPGAYVIEDLALERAMLIPAGGAVTTQFVRRGETEFEIFGRPKGSDSPWVRHASGKLRRRQEGEAPKPIAAAILDRCRLEVAKDAFYQHFHNAGIQYGPPFQGVAQLWCGEGEAYGRIAVDPELDADWPDYLLHPAILDAGFQVLAGTLALAALRNPSAAKAGNGGVYLPVRIGRIRFYGRSAKNLTVHARVVECTARCFKGDLLLIDDGNVLAEVAGLECRAIERPAEKINNYLYQEQWNLQARSGQLVARRDAGYLLPPSEIAARLADEGERLRQDFGLDRCETIEPEVRQLANAYVLGALKHLGWKFELGQPISAEGLIAQLGILSDHRRLLERTLENFGADGFLAIGNEGWVLHRLPDEVDTNEVWASLWRRYPSMQAELILVRRCGEQLPGVLKGAVDPLEAIFPEGSLTTADHLYQDSPSYRIYNILAEKSVAAALERLPHDRTLRILEIGGGTGGLSTYVLRSLPRERTEYVFSDVTQFLTSHAEQKFRDYPFVQYRVLDIESDPIAQGYEPHSFDLILASDVLHATRDLRDSLTHIKQLLASDGMLVLLELTQPPRWLVLVFGLLKGWWRFADSDLRPKEPCISQRAWRNLLAEAGFTDVACLADTPVGEKAEHSVIMARGPKVELDGASPESQDKLSNAAGTWLIFADCRGIGDDLARRLRDRGARTVLAYAGDTYERAGTDRFRIRPRSDDDMRHLVAAVAEDPGEFRDVVHLWSLDAAPSDESLAAMESTQVTGCFHVLSLLHVLEKVERPTPARLWLVTAGAQAAGPMAGPVSFTQASLWGLCRTITTEHPDHRAHAIDLSESPSAGEVESLLEELLAGEADDEVALRGASRYVHRVSRLSVAAIQESAKQTAPVESCPPFRLEIANPGMLDTLTLRGCERPAPGPAEVEIQVLAAALNFRDVMLTMGLLPDEAIDGGSFGRALGMECAGRISAVGERVKGFKIGDRVVTCAPGTLGSHVLADAGSVAPIPGQLSFEEATTIPIAFTTAYYALHHLARIQKGERVLIHAAAGGVGLAAFQLAKLAGAEVYATAGTEVKRDLLRALGARFVADSRSLSFAEQILEATGGKGVDIVLNSLAGESIARSFAVLGPYGRFVEIGKRDIFENSRIELRPFRANLSYFGVDLDRAYAERPDFVRSLMGRAMAEFADEKLHPLAYRSFPIAEAVNGFRYMAQAKHIGKVAVSFANCNVVVTPPAQSEIAFGADGTYLITGGTGGFGLAVAQWLVSHGARHLVLMGRNDASPQAAAAIAALGDAGAQVSVAKADVTLECDVERVLAGIASSGSPLKGVMHAAMVLDDALLHELDETRMRRAMWPKVAGAWNLHWQTRDLPLDHFVLFSSFSAIIGTGRQGNYVAANTFLDALAHHRCAQGLAALSVNWGVVADTGYVSRNTELLQKLDQLGFSPLPAQQMLDMLGVLIREKAAQVGVANLNWQQLAKIPMIGSSKRFAYLVKPELSDGDSKNGAWLIDAIMAVDPSERQVFLQNHVREQLARVLDTSPSKIDVDTPLINLGLDSLMAVEIGHRVQSQLGISIPAVKFLEGMTTAGMAQYLIEHLCGTESAGIARAAAAAPLQLRSAPPDTGDASRRLIDLPPVHGSDGMPHNGSGAASDEHSLAHMERLVANLSDDAVDALFEHLSTTPESLMPADWQPDGALRRAAGDGDD
jgi:acyl transferase domain-containing protein/NADPH:quinone reductase-like Zn-dependent oxidoreductase/SAM-dependent methyltransferase/acyl carrier protein